jgi:hypothetical protein
MELGDSLEAPWMADSGMWSLFLSYSLVSISTVLLLFDLSLAAVGSRSKLEAYSLSLFTIFCPCLLQHGRSFPIPSFCIPLASGCPARTLSQAFYFQTLHSPL